MTKVIRNAAGQPFSKWKPAEKFDYMLGKHWPTIRTAGAPEHVFDSAGRRWRFDFAWPEQRVAVEIDGFGYGHQAQKGMAEDNEKANAAVEQGWRVLRFNSRQLGSKQGVVDAVDMVARLVCGAKS